MSLTASSEGIAAQQRDCRGGPSCCLAAVIGLSCQTQCWCRCPHADTMLVPLPLGKQQKRVRRALGVRLEPPLHC